MDKQKAKTVNGHRSTVNEYKVQLKSIKLFGYHGVLPEEQEKGQDFLIDIKLSYDKSSEEDDLSSAVDYAKVNDLVRKVFESKRYNLLESLAKDTSDEIINNFPPIRKLQVKITKSGSPVGLDAENVSVSIKLKR